LQERRDHFAVELSCQSPNQVLYTALLEALGYASNREAFTRLADLVPFAWLADIPADYRLQAVIDAAGLGSAARIPPPARLESGSWRLARLRPDNHPARRLRGAMQLLERLGPDPAAALTRVVLCSTTSHPLQSLLVVSGEQRALIGPGRANEIAVSVVIPFVAAFSAGSTRPEELYGEYPSPPWNRWTRTMQAMFRQAGHEIKPNTALQHQGLHRQHQRHCRLERRSGCPVCGSD
jgi:hypothetical protein